MLFNIVPQDVFYPPVHHVQPHVRCRRQSPDLEFLRRLGFAPALMRPDGCCRGRISQDTCPKSIPQTTGCCKEPVSTKLGEKQTTVEKSTLDFRGFSPEEIKVKVTDKCVMVRGEQKEGHTNLQITKTVPLPEGTDRKNIACRYEDGFITVHIPVTQPKRLEKSPEKLCRDVKLGEKGEGRKEEIDMDKRRKTELERSVKTLGDLFSSLFGLQLEGEEEKTGTCDTGKCEDEKRQDEKHEDEKGGDEKRGDEKREDEKCEDEKCQDEKREDEKCEDEKCQDGKHGEGKRDEEREGLKCDEVNYESERRDDEQVEAVDSLEEKISKEISESVESPKSVSSTPMEDGEQTLVLTLCGDMPTRDDVDDFVHLEKQEAEDKCLVEFPGSDEENDVTKLMTSLNDYSSEKDHEDDEDEKSTAPEDETETTEKTEPNVFKLELDLSSYKPEQIRVVFKDGEVIVQAEREIEGENYSETENLTRRIRVPENVDESKLKSYLSEEGLLTVQAPYKERDESTWKTIKVNLED